MQRGSIGQVLSTVPKASSEKASSELSSDLAGSEDALLCSLLPCFGPVSSKASISHCFYILKTTERESTFICRMDQTLPLPHMQIKVSGGIIRRACRFGLDLELKRVVTTSKPGGVGSPVEQCLNSSALKYTAL